MTHEWLITKTTIEAEMLRLAGLLSSSSHSSHAHAGLRRHDAMATNAALKGVITAFAGSL